MKKYFIGLILALISCMTYAGVSIESACYQSEGVHGAGGKGRSFFFFKSYRDEDDHTYIGGFVNYNNSKLSISVVYDSEVQGVGGYSGDFQRTWLEIVDRKITGQYVEYGNYDGNPGGRYIKYTGYKDGRVVLFRISMNNSPCLGN